MSSLPELAEALLKPEAYPDVTSRVELMQTQMSFVFLTDKYVYKVKKAVNLGYLDYTTLEQRRFYCQREVELNRRLCPEVYLGIVPISRGGQGIVIGGQGQIFEYAVKMLRLPREAMLDVLLANNQVSPPMIAKVAQKLAVFHRQAATSAEINIFGNLENITRNTEENFTQTEKYFDVTISREQHKRIKEYNGGFIKRNVALFNRRIAEGRIRDCHGDLHAAHICFSNGICIYDCIEFNDRFRYGDVAGEVAFLAMDLDHYGRADLSRHFVRAYVAASGDEALPELLKFYKCYRACVRGKVESFKLDDPYISVDEKGRVADVASSYFDLAGAYSKSSSGLFITTGLVGTGKSEVAQALAKRLGLVVLSSDVTRKQLLAVALAEHRFENFGEGIYSPEISRLTYDTLLTEAKKVLSGNDSVIIDASFIKAGERLRAQSLAQEIGADFLVIECTLDKKIAKQRLDERLKQGSVSDGRWEIYEPQRNALEPVVEIPALNHVIIDTALPVRETVRQVLAKLSGRIT